MSIVSKPNSRKNQKRSLRVFVRQNRKTIDEYVLEQTKTNHRLNDNDREKWVLNDELLYSWALHCEVNI